VTEAIAGYLIAAGVDSALAARLAEYGALMLASTANVTGAKDAAAVAGHLLDSLTLLPYVREPFIDVGTGGGLPGVPLVLATGFAATLLDASAKNTAFLRGAIGTLGIDRVAVVTDRAEAAGRSAALRERFACATARAVSAAPTVLELVVPFLAVGGTAVLQRGAFDDRERAAVTDAALVLGAELTQEIALTGERRILIVTKVRPTGDRFPRRNGVPEKRPLCVS
jgi:16S rRNA (guanine527-N7)-methyltransferase